MSSDFFETVCYLGKYTIFYSLKSNTFSKHLFDNHDVRKHNFNLCTIYSRKLFLSINV